MPWTLLQTFHQISSSYPIMLTVHILIMMVHVWLQPYKQRKLSILDSFILMILMLVFIGEHTSNGSTIVLWILSFILFINYLTLSSLLRFFLKPISCLEIIIFSVFIPSYFLDLAISDDSFYSINFVIILLSSLALFVYLIYDAKLACVVIIQ